MAERIAADAQVVPELRITAAKSALWPRLDEVWRFRDLLYLLAWRDIRLRYKQTAIGVAWAVLQPLLTMAVFAVVFGRLAGMPSSGVPYPLFALCGLVPWQFFSFGLTSAANSLVGNERLLTKVYFPRVILPAAALLAGVLDFLVALLLLLGLMAWYGLGLGPALLAFPFFLLLTLAAALAVGVGLSALSVRYRDVRHALPFLTQFWMFATPIAYPSSLFPEHWRPLLGLNPMAGVVEGFRWALLGTERPSGRLLALSTVTVLGGLALATAFFVRTERTMADEI